MYTKNILTLLNLDHKEITISENVIENDNEYIIVGQISNNHERTCPKCGSLGVVKEKITVYQNHSMAKFHQKNLLISMTKRRFKCVNCNITWTQNLPYIERKRTITNDVMLSIYDDCKRVISFSDIARKHNVSVTTVINVFDNICFEKAVPLRICVCIDEFYFKVTKYNKFPAVLSDAKTGRILDIIPSRKKEYLNQYFSKKNSIERNTVKYFSCDLNEVYREIAHKWFPNAIVVADFFHVTKLLTTVLNAKRVKYMKSISTTSSEYKFMKKHWRYFLMNNENLTKLNKTISDKFGNNFYISEYVYQIAKNNYEFLEMYLIYRDYGWLMAGKKGTDRKTIQRNLEFIINKCLSSQFDDVTTLGSTLLEWSEEIINAYSEDNKHNISNGIAESNNNRIEKLIEVGNGYKNLNRLTKRVLLIEKNEDK